MGVDTDSGAFIPTTQIFDRSIIEDLNLSPDFKDFLVRLLQTTNDMANSINIRDAGLYEQTEFVNGQQWFPNPLLSSATTQAPEARQVFRKVINFGGLPNNTSKTSAHGITMTDTYTFTRIYATASDTTGHTYIPIPYASATAANIVELSVNGTNATITTGVDRTAYDTCYVVIEYIKQ